MHFVWRMRTSWPPEGCGNNHVMLSCKSAVNRNILSPILLILSDDISLCWSPTDCLINWFALLGLILEYSLSQSWKEWNWRFWSHCPGWCSESEPELDNTEVSNYPGPILTYEQSVISKIWLSWVTVVPVWSPCTMLITTVTFLTVWTLVVEAIPASLSCQ